MLKSCNIKVINVTSSSAKINQSITPDYKLLNLGNWDWFSIFHLKQIVAKTRPDIIIAHGGRAAKFAYYAKGLSHLVGITHSHKLKWIEKSDYIITLTKYMYNKAFEAGISKDKLIILPNSIDMTKFDITKAHNSEITPHITTMGRFVQKKGIDVFIRAIHILKERNIALKASIGGTGEDEKELRSLVKTLKLENEIEFTGWVYNPEQFFKATDIFCLPSREEPFGVVLLEAMLFSLPIVSTMSEGPREILTHNKDALLVQIDSPIQIADAVEQLIKNSKEARSLGHEAYLTVARSYDMKIVGDQLASHLSKILLPK
jgi:glycosyltransferase involved in cell wall biosynthesis